MATLRTTNLQHPSSADANIVLAADGSVSFASSVLPGIGSNVVQTVKTDVFTTTSTSFTAITGLTATITPTSSSSKILVIVTINASNDGASAVGQGMTFRLTGGNTSGFIGNADGSRTQGFSGHGHWTGSQQSLHTIHAEFLDSPATDLPVTYGVDVRRQDTITVTVNRSGADTNNGNQTRGVSTITLIEVAA